MKIFDIISFHIKNTQIIINPTVLICLPFLIFIDGSVYIIPVLLSIFIHESAHIICILLMKKNISLIRIMPFGIQIEIKIPPQLSYINEIFSAAAGPLSNLLFFIFTVFLYKYLPNPYIAFFGGCNFILMLINLLPIFPLDGGRVVYALLLKHINIVTAALIMDIISFIMLLLLLISGMYVLINTGYNFSLIIIFIFLSTTHLLRLVKK